MQREWLSLVEAEGTGAVCRPPSIAGDPEGELPCPACGTAAPLVAGACTDCGLQLE
ncbi:MAG TPA: hypothetical protein VML75_21480 [Kofleriaceae bacterium]|nr:hypothetical protein [Kofleriaceae bacterium]